MRNMLGSSALNKTLGAFIFLVLGSITVFAQSSNTTNVYELIRNDAKNGLYNNASIGTDLLWLDVGESVKMGGSLYARYVWQNKVRINMGYDAAYLDGIDGPSCNVADDCLGFQGLSLEETKNHRAFRFGVNYFFSQNIEETEEKIFIKQKGNTIYSGKVPADMSTVYGVRFEYMSSYSYVFSGNGNLDFNMYAVNDPTDVITRRGHQYSTMMTKTVLCFGANRIQQHDLLIALKGLGERGAQYSSEIYADIMLATGMKYSNMIISDSISSSNRVVSWKEYNVDDNTETANLGFRIGYMLYPASTFSAHYGVELGVAPGPDTGMLNRIYLGMKLGLYLSFKA